MLLSFVIALVAFSFVGVSQVQAAEKKGNVTIIKGAIEKIDGKTLTVDGKDFSYTDSTKIILDGKPYTETLTVGQHITARVEKGVAVRIEIHGKKDAHKHDEKNKTSEKAL